QQNVRSLSDLCSLQPWQPPFDRVDPRQLVHAEKLKRAMANTVLRIQDPALRHLPKTELARLGMPEFKAVFGYEITARRWLEIIDRVIERDRGFNQFHRVHLYLAKDDTIR